MKRFAENFATLVADVVRRPTAAVQELDIISPLEHQQLLAVANCTSPGLPEEAALHGLFAEQAQQNPDRVALTCQEQSLTYGELNTRANQLA